jgi:tRNA(Ile)-lysidine synthase
MLDRVLKTIREHNMISIGDIVLVGFSGGADSMALLHILKQLAKTMDIRIYAAHVHHGIRGTAADQDADFVARVCQRWHVPLFMERAEVPKLAKKWSVTEEEAGRIVRHDFFDKVLTDIGGNKIALGHHKDDQAETILHNILRGTGMQGLQGIKPIGGRLIRPLLHVSRAEIENYCYEKGLSFRMDASNKDVGYTRNRIRCELIPYIEQNFNPSFVDTIIRMGRIIGDEDEFLDRYCRELFKTLVLVDQDKVIIRLESFLSCVLAVKRRILRMCLEKLRGDLQGVQANHIENILKMVSDSRTGAVLSLPGDVMVWKDHDEIIMSLGACKWRTPAFEYSLPIPGKVLIPECNIEILSRRVQHKEVCFTSPWCIYIDEDVIKGNLKVRNRRTGDRFKPFGMKGTKKLKDFFIDKKIPQRKRDGIPLLVDEDNIIWVVGYQTHGDYAITRYTRNIVELKTQLIS